MTCGDAKVLGNRLVLLEAAATARVSTASRVVILRLTSLACLDARVLPRSEEVWGDLVPLIPALVALVEVVAAVDGVEERKAQEK